MVFNFPQTRCLSHQSSPNWARIMRRTTSRIEFSSTYRIGYRPPSVTYTCRVSYHSPMNTSNSLEMSTFLESAPLLEPRLVTLELKNPGSGYSPEVAMPAVYLYCPGEPCRGLRFYDYRGHSVSLPSQGKYREFFLAYICRNCEGSLKTYAVRVIRTELNEIGRASC